MGQDIIASCRIAKINLRNVSTTIFFDVVGNCADGFDGSRDIKFWLRGIMRNKIVDQIRKAVKESKVDIDSETLGRMTFVWSRRNRLFLRHAGF